MVGLGSRRCRGAVLIVVLGILAVLALLATTFATLQAVERQVSRNYMDTVRAKLLAMSGVQEAVHRLSVQLDTATPGTPEFAMQTRAARYYGSDVDELGNRPDLLNVRVEDARNPSFAIERDGNPIEPSQPQPRELFADGPSGQRKIGVSGIMQSGTYGRNGDVYALRVSDLQGLIHVNDGVEHGPQGAVSQNLKRLLNNLGKQVGIMDLGDRILAARPQTGYTSKTDLLAAVDYDRVRFEKFQRFVTVRAWQDDKVANPVPLSPDVLREYPVRYYRGTPELCRYGRGKDAWGAVLASKLTWAPFDPWTSGNIAVFGTDELNPQWIEIVRRAPINVNAAPREVLVAVLDGLKGFFMTDRRRNEPPAHDNVYNWYRLSYSYRPTGPGGRGGELGYLYSTVSIDGPGTGTGAVNNWAGKIADEIIACREQKGSPNISGLDYKAVPFGGPFMSWRQFGLFCDRLSDLDNGGFLVDDRDIYRDYHPSSRSPVPSEIQKRFASRAISDVLKANFNPNLHLNETNPEIQLWQRVDKTDLIVSSTEFCFTPMGYYEIESLGRVLRPLEGEDALVSQNEIMAEKKVVATVKLFDAYRETHQAEFYRGTLSRRFGRPTTNNNQSMEIGPEPDSGDGPSENEWSGYLALPTVGGHEQSPGPARPRNTLGRTPWGGSEWSSEMHAHFTYDGRLHHHVSGRDYAKELASEVERNEFVENAPDPVPAGLQPGPYTPLSSEGNKHRLARSFRLPYAGGPGTSAMPALVPMAPLDLRVDGMYLERHCSMAYWLDAATMGASIGESQGVVAFWAKPGFLPEMTGKARQILSADRLHGPRWGTPAGGGAGSLTYFQPSPFCLWLLASHDAMPFSAPPSESASPFYNPGYPWGVQPMRTTAMTFGYGYSTATGYAERCIAEGGFVTPCLNHEAHPDGKAKRSLMRGHRWMHVVATWRTKSKEDCQIFVNGQGFPGANTAWYQNYLPDSQKAWYVHETGEQNVLRLGPPSRYLRTGIEAYQRNWPADATLDEFFWWNRRDRLGDALALGRLGRFYKPINNGYEEGSFTSQEITLRMSTRMPAPPSAAAPPGATGSGPGSTSPGPEAAAFLPGKIRLLGATWTCYGELAEENDPQLEERMHDYGSSDADLPVVAELWILQKDKKHGPFRDARYSRLADPDGRAVEVDGPFSYRVQFKIQGLALDSQLLATPIFDDVTLFYQEGGPQFLSYMIE
jgi:hypothetical protein